MAPFIDLTTQYLPLLATTAVVLAILYLLNRVLRRHWATQPDAKFHFQLVMLALTVAGVLGVVLALPISATLRGQLLSLIGILLSAAIALSATTFIGNMMAGIMLRAIRNARPGDFITVNAITGRVTEMALLHTEVQTEDSDLVTIPNLYLVTQPTKVVRASGTIVSAQVSLGYDVARTRVSEALLQAADDAGLEDGFVHVRELGDYSVLYRVAGLLKDVSSLISARSRLRECMLDALHGAGIEIVSPTFMNTRALGQGAQIIPQETPVIHPHESVAAEAVAFEKADEAASIQQLQDQLADLGTQLASADLVDAEPQRKAMEGRRELLAAQIETAKEHQHG